jgi:hypothetical protein
VVRHVGQPSPGWPWPSGSIQRKRLGLISPGGAGRGPQSRRRLGPLDIMGRGTGWAVVRETPRQMGDSSGDHFKQQGSVNRKGKNDGDTWRGAGRVSRSVTLSDLSRRRRSCGVASVVACARMCSPERMAGQTACPEEASARARQRWRRGMSAVVHDRAR